MFIRTTMTKSGTRACWLGCEMRIKPMLMGPERTAQYRCKDSWEILGEELQEFFVPFL
jgi:hypothetical protein